MKYQPAKIKPVGVTMTYIKKSPPLKLDRVWVRSGVRIVPLDEINKHKWSWFSKREMAVGNIDGVRIPLHQFLTKLAGYDWAELQFGNGDRTDLRLNNLRPYRRDIEGSMRTWKKKKNKGIHWRPDMGKWQAMIRVRRKLKHLGYFVSAMAAAAAYAQALKLKLKGSI